MIKPNFWNHTCKHCRAGLAELKQTPVEAEAGGYTSVALLTFAVPWLVDYVEAHMPQEDTNAPN